MLHPEDDYKAGSARHSRLLADSMALLPDGMTMGPSDTRLCVRALKAYAARWHRLALVVLALVAALAVGGSIGFALA